MTRVRVDISISLDGYVAGPDQSLENPIGRGGMRLHEWVFPLRTFRAMTGEDGGETGVNDKALQRAHDGIGAVIMGRHMFGPGRGAWDREWKGWWGPNPPYHTPVFVLTHHPRESLVMEGGTRSFSRPTVSLPRSGEHARRQVRRATSRSPAVPTRSSSTSPRGWWTNSRSTSSR